MRKRISDLSEEECIAWKTRKRLSKLAGRLGCGVLAFLIPVFNGNKAILLSLLFIMIVLLIALIANFVIEHTQGVEISNLGLSNLSDTQLSANNTEISDTGMQSDPRPEENTAFSTAITEEKVSAVCQKCGAVLPDESTFCHKCGNRIEENTCPYCGAELISDADFCAHCGKRVRTGERAAKCEQKQPLPEPVQQEDKEVAVPPMSEPPQEENIESAQPEDDSISDEELRKLVGPNAQYYLPQFELAKEHKKTSFNWAAFLFGSAFCYYRKSSELCWKFFVWAYLLAGIIPLIFTLIGISYPVERPSIWSNFCDAFLLSIIGLAAYIFICALICGGKFNAEYYRHCSIKAAKGKRLGNNATSLLSGGLAVVVTVLYGIGICIVCVLLLIVLPPSADQNRQYEVEQERELLEIEVIIFNDLANENLTVEEYIMLKYPGFLGISYGASDWLKNTLGNSFLADYMEDKDSNSHIDSPEISNNQTSPSGYMGIEDFPFENFGVSAGSEDNSEGDYSDNSYNYHYLLPTDTEYIDSSDLEDFDKDELVLVRNEIYARHGYNFKDEKIRAYFNAQSWYEPVPGVDASTFSDAVFNNYERKNLETIVAYEQVLKQQSSNVNPSDFVGNWTDQYGRYMTIEKARNGSYAVQVYFQSGSWLLMKWNFTAQFDTSSNELIYQDGVYMWFATQGMVEEEETTIYTNGTGSFRFEDGYLCWYDDMDVEDWNWNNNDDGYGIFEKMR